MLQPRDPLAQLGASIRTLLATDLVDSTRLVAALGNQRSAELSEEHARLARGLLKRHGGREIAKTDGFLLLFARPVDAVTFALAYHAGLDELGERIGAPLTARVALHLGSIHLRANDPEDVARGAKPLEVEGQARLVADRLLALSRPRQTLLTRGAFDLARQAAFHEPVSRQPVRWLAHGTYLLSGVEDPMEVFEVGVEGTAPLAVPPDAEKARRAVADGDEAVLGWRPAPGLAVPHRPTWVLRDKLGEGGFGEVWLAVHTQTGEKRTFKFCFQAERLRSLQREVTLFRLLRESLGQRDDIVRILEWNFTEAPFFIEAEYTEGGNLLEWVEGQGGAEAIPLETRLELMAQVAEALAASHSVGVLHKDVKPTNVLVDTGPDGRPRARLTDFGIGLVLDRRTLLERGITVAGLTEMASDGTGEGHGGTHLYMAPELLTGRTPSTGADLYALGVMTWQFVVRDFGRALAAGWSRDVPSDLLRDDLAAMVDGSPERRLRTAGEAAERLRTLDQRLQERQREQQRREEEEAERHALDEAVRRRNRSVLVAAAALLVLVLVSAFALRASVARQEADHRRGQAQELLAFMLGDLYEKLGRVGRTDLLERVSAEARDYFTNIPERDLSEEERYQLATLMRNAGGIEARTGHLDAAFASYTQALELNRSLVDGRPDHLDWRAGLAESHYGVGVVHLRRGDLDRARHHFERQLDEARELADREPDNPEWRTQMAYAHNNLGSTALRQERLEDALESFRASLALRSALHRENPTDPTLRENLAYAHNTVGDVLRRLGDLEGALEHFQADLALNQALAREVPLDAAVSERLAVSLSYVAFALELQGRLGEAATLMDRSLDIYGRLVDQDPSNAQWRRHGAAARLRRGKIALEAGQHERAGTEAGAAVATLEELTGLAPEEVRWRQDLAIARTLLAETLLAETLLTETSPGEDPAATRTLDAALDAALDARRALAELLERAPQELDTRRLLAATETCLGEIHRTAGEPEAARAAWERAVTLLEGAAASSDVRVVATLAEPLLHLGRTAEAVPLLERLREQGYRDPTLTRLCTARGACGAALAAGGARRSATTGPTAPFDPGTRTRPERPATPGV